VPGFLKNPAFIKLLKRLAGNIPLVIILLASTFGAGQASAGVFSLFSVASGETYSENAPTIQKMKILEVAFSPTLTGKGGQDIITDESALISNDTPLTADIGQDEKLDEVIDHQGEATIRTYIVKKGDTISTIADAYGVSVNTIVWANNLDRKSALMVGDTLTILPVSGIYYTVRRGDTLASIAHKYSAEITDIRDYNDKNDDSLFVGEKIVVPGAELVPVKPIVIAQADSTKSAKVPSTPVVEDKPQVQAKTFSENSVENKPAETNAGENTTNRENNNEGSSPPTGTLARPKTNTGDSSSFIRPITEGVGRKSQDKHDTWAVDIAAPIGTPILAAQKGTVILVKALGYNGGYGKYIAIEHENGVQTLYAHMTKTIAKVGDIVEQGQTIGLVGSTGRSTGPHVHYEVRGALNNCFKTCE
jgi:murein DD-endopeptidase MepM/ murein hydrolase activator NlpD